MNTKLNNYLIIVLFLVFFLLFPLNIFAQDAQKDYEYKLDKYNQQSITFLTAKNQYLKLKTSASETKATTETKNYIYSQANLLRTYFLLLISKLNLSPNLNPSLKNEYIKKAQDQLVIIDNYQKSVQDLNNPKLETLTSISEKFSKYQESFTKISQEIRFVLIHNKSANYTKELKSLKKDLQNFSQGKNISGIDDIFLEISSLENKLDKNIENTAEQINLIKEEKDSYKINKSIESFNSTLESLKTNLKKSLNYQKNIINQLKEKLDN